MVFTSFRFLHCVGRFLCWEATYALCFNFFNQYQKQDLSQNRQKWNWNLTLQEKKKRTYKDKREFTNRSRIIKSSTGKFIDNGLNGILLHISIDELCKKKKTRILSLISNIVLLLSNLRVSLCSLVLFRCFHCQCWEKWAERGTWYELGWKLILIKYLASRPWLCVPLPVQVPAFSCVFSYDRGLISDFDTTFSCRPQVPDVVYWCISSWNNMTLE